jgi:hypothetical protein
MFKYQFGDSLYEQYTYVYIYIILVHTLKYTPMSL